jgi:hypothetical protein
MSTTRQGNDRREDSAACSCEGPLRNVTVDGNRGHAPGCPMNPHTWGEHLTHCVGCGIPFTEPITLEQALTDFPDDLESAGYACEGCDV